MYFVAKGRQDDRKGAGLLRRASHNEAVHHRYFVCAWSAGAYPLHATRGCGENVRPSVCLRFRSSGELLTHDLRDFNQNVIEALSWIGSENLVKPLFPRLLKEYSSPSFLEFSSDCRIGTTTLKVLHYSTISLSPNPHHQLFYMKSRSRCSVALPC